jgi:hypothetical protein
VSESQVRADLQKVFGDKAKLMQQYSDEQKEILSKYGGGISDIPMNPDHEYHKLQDKIRILGQLK